VVSQFIRSMSLFWVFFRVLADYWWLDKTDRFRSEEARRAAEERAYRRWGRLLRNTALRLTGLIIKVGQFLSARADVMPAAFIQELSALQDAVPAAPFSAIRKRVEAELGAPIASVFTEFDEIALASASLGQVHKARLAEGQVVAVKVLRPGIERLVATDMAALWKMARFLQKRTKFGRRFDLEAIMEEFETITYQEMDYRQEAENIRRFRKNFAGTRGIDVPFPMDNLVSQRLLVMEYKAGFKLTDRERLLACGIQPEAMAERLIDAYLKQLLVDGFVHVDPHPGNLMAEEDGTLVFVDFGMMGTITPEDRKGFADLAATLLTRDLDGAVRALDGLGFLRRKDGNDPLKKALAFLLDRLSGVKLQPGPEFDQLLEEFREWIYEEPLQFPARYLFIGRAIGLLAGLATSLNPGIDWVKVLKERALPMLDAARTPPPGAGGGAATGEGPGNQGFDWRKLLNELFGPGAATAADVVLQQAKTTGLSLVKLPGQMERTLNRIESGSVQVQTDLSPLTERLDRQNRYASRLAWALVAAGAGITGAILRVGGFPAETRVAWGIAGVALVLLLGNALFTRTGSKGRRRAPHPTFRRSR